MGRPVRRVVTALALVVVYACSATAPGEGGSSSGGSSSSGSTSGSSSSSGSSGDDASTDASGSSDSARSSDGSVVTEGGSSDASPDAIADAASDVSVDAAADGGTCPIQCVTNDFFPDGRPMPPNGGSANYCIGGCTWYGSTPPRDYHNVCHMTCGGVCAPDPPYGGICPAECTGGCADGVCNITCDGNDPALSCVQSFVAAPPPAFAPYITKPIVKCPAGMPCKVTCRNKGCSNNIVACPREDVSCDVDCGFAPEAGCGGTQFYCGTGRCNVHGETPGAGVPRNVNYPEYNLPHDVCGKSCSCSLPYYTVFAGAHVRCQCKDGTTFNYGNGGGGIYGGDACPVRCADHGGWSAPWERTPYSW